MSGAPCGSCRRWVPESGSSIFCTLCGGSFQLVRLAQDPKFTARDFLDLSSRITHLIGEFTVRVGSSVQEVSSHPPPPPPPPRQNSSQEGRGPPSSPRKHREDSPDWKPFPPPISFDPQSTGKGSSSTSRSRACTSTFKVASCRAPSCSIPNFWAACWRASVSVGVEERESLPRSSSPTLPIGRLPSELASGSRHCPR